MQIVCPQCSQTLTYEHQTPKFCQFCGSGLNPTVSTPSDTAQPSAMQTVPPTGVPADQTIAPTGPAPQAIDQTSVGETVGPYRTVKWLGAGGMGSVWQAEEVKTGRQVALKRLAPAIASDKDSLDRFLQEAMLAAKISHPNVTFIYCTGEDNAAPYIAMELMLGETLEDRVNEEGPLSVRRAVDYIIDVIDGLQAVHKKGMIHRDVKPSNCFIGANNVVKIGDFGLSKSMVSENASLTKTGTFMGTPSYASPEQIRGIDVDERTDQYSVAATLYFLLTAQTPYHGDATSMMAQIIGDPPPSARAVNASVPHDLDLLIRKTLAKSPDDRYPSLRELRAALLPFASRFNSVADAGRRLAAYMIDQTSIQLVAVVLGITLGIVAMVMAGERLSDQYQIKLRFWSTLGMSLVFWLYYTISESVFQRTIGKWLMGLKLVNYENQKASLWRTGLRAFFVPLSMGIPLAYAMMQYRSGNFATPTNPADFTLMMMVGLAIGFGPILLCLTTMRKSNRLTGLHGLISGTRVVRASQVTKQALLPVADQRTHQVAERVFGPYHSDQLLGECEYGKIYLAHDDLLNRQVWVVARESTAETPKSRLDLSRKARQRWYDGGECDGETPGGKPMRWDAFEAVEGMPIQQLVGIGKLGEGGGYAKLMQQLVQELSQAVKDDTLPPTLQMSQVWVGKEGNLKLLDSPLVDHVTVSDKDSSICLLSGEFTNIRLTPIERAVELVQQLGDVIMRSRLLPVSLKRLLNELDTKEKNEATLKWADEELERLVTQTKRLTWDMRIGILAMTMGVEALAYSLISAGLMLVCYHMLPITMSTGLALGIAVSLILPMAIAAYFGGGLIFHVMKIRVCSYQGNLVSPWICAIRAGLSWLPWFALGGGFMLIMILADAKQRADAAEPGTVDFAVTHDPSLVVAALILILVSMLSIAGGIVFSVFSPRRGLIDYLMRTRLMPE